MKHLREGSTAFRVHQNRSITEVRVVMQHDDFGTFFDTGRRVMQAWHGELHETREQAEEYVSRIGGEPVVSDRIVHVK